jgi:ssDNA-binding Zn-finger/Zn-ribbon topoisomerase 1
MSLQEKVCGDGTKDATKASDNDASEKVENKGTAEEEKADVFDELVDLDYYLDTLMLYMTMSIAKGKEGGDRVAIVECPHDEHKVDLTTGKGFFLVDAADVARKTLEEMLGYADATQDVVGCAGYPDCNHSLAQVIENSELPDEVFCFEGHPNHLAKIDPPCESHAATTSGQRQVIFNLCKLQAEVRKGSNKAVKAKVNLPVIRIVGIGGERPTLVQGTGEVQEEDVRHLPTYIRRLKHQVIDFKPSKPSEMPPANTTVSIAK